MKNINVKYGAGLSRANIDENAVYMCGDCRDEDGRWIWLYAERPEDGHDVYEVLKAEILQQAAAQGIDAARLVFRTKLHEDYAVKPAEADEEEEEDEDHPRYSSEPGTHSYPDPDMRDEELAAAINAVDTWDADLLRELCWRAGMIAEWDAAGDDFETVAYAAAAKLGLSI